MDRLVGQCGWDCDVVCISYYVLSMLHTTYYNSLNGWIFLNTWYTSLLYFIVWYMANPLLHVKINSPEKILWEGEAEWVSSENSKGPFDILPLHTNFISILENKKIRIKTTSKVEEFSYPWSVIYTHNNQVAIYTNIWGSSVSFYYFSSY